MKRPTLKVPLIGIVIGIVALTFTVPAVAHVTVKPTEAVTAAFQTFTVSVPNEKDIPTISVKVVMPKDLKYVTPTQKAGWEVEREVQGTGDSEKVTSITWSGGAIAQGLRDEFTFSAQVPEKATELQWKACQTYSDGTVVSWDQASEGGHGEGNSNAGPFSVTKVVAETSQDTAIAKADQAAADAESRANTALYFGTLGVLVGLIGIYFGTRKQNK